MNRFAKLMQDYGAATFFLPFAIILLVMGYFFWQSADRTKNFPQTQAVVTNLELFEEEHYENGSRQDATYTVTVKYTVDGKEYEEEYGIHSGYKLGDSLTICYNPDDPTDIAQPIGTLLPIAFLIGGVACLIGTVISVIKTHQKNKALKQQEEEWNHA